MELAIIPFIVQTGAPASRNWSPGGWELIIILIIALILSGVKRLSDLKDMAGGMAESIRNFTESIRNFKSGRRPEPSRQSSDSRPWVFIVIALTAAAVVVSIHRLDVFSGKQELVLAIAVICWIGVGYWSFGRNLRKRSGQ
jgi:Sec-independent protein translocase protein TatA